MTQLNISEKSNAKTNRLYIPDIGDKFVLADPWTFMVYCESRNYKLIEALKLTSDAMTKGWHLYRLESYGSPMAQCTLPAGSRLQVDRVYIRQGLGSFSSITFKLLNPDLSFPNLPKMPKTIRFWAKLGEVNMANMVTE